MKKDEKKKKLEKIRIQTNEFLQKSRTLEETLSETPEYYEMANAAYAYYKAELQLLEDMKKTIFAKSRNLIKQKSNTKKTVSDLESEVYADETWEKHLISIKDVTLRMAAAYGRMTRLKMEWESARSLNRTIT